MKSKWQCWLLRSIVLHIMVLFVAHGTQAQDVGLKNGFAFSGGVAHLANRDELASPFRYGGASLSLALRYEYSGSYNRHQLHVRFLHINLRSTLSEALGPGSHESDYYGLTMRYAFARRVAKAFSGKWHIFAGGAWDNLLAFRIYTYSPRLEEETIAEVFSMLKLHGLAERRLGEKQRVQISLALGLAGFAFRNPYGVTSDRIGAIGTHHSFVGAFMRLAEFIALDDLVLLQSAATYTLALSSRIDVQAALRLAYMRFSEPRPSVSIENSLATGIAFKF